MPTTRLLLAAAFVLTAVLLISCSSDSRHHSPTGTSTSSDTASGTSSGTATGTSTGTDTGTGTATNPFVGTLTWERYTGTLTDHWHLWYLELPDNGYITTIEQAYYPVGGLPDCQVYSFSLENYAYVAELLDNADFFSLDSVYEPFNGTTGNYVIISYDDGTNVNVVTVYDNAILVPKGLNTLVDELQAIWEENHK